MATTSTEINDLPVEMLLEILEKLPIRELVAYCVEVCPQWKNAIDCKIHPGAKNPEPC